MKKILFAFFLALLQVCAFAQTPFTAPWGFNYSAPTGAPSALGTRVRFDITTGRIYTWSPDALNWQLQGYTIDQISGTSAPAYAPVRGQSWFAVNGDTLPRLYQYTGSGTTWKCLNCSDGKTYTAGTGITLSGPNSTVINNAGDLSATNELNTGFDISGGNLRIIDAGATRTVAITSIAPDQSVTNELQTIDTFLVSGSNLLLSLTQDNQPAKTITLPASGITALTGDVTASGPGSAVATIAAGAVTAGKLASMGASSGQVLGWNGSIWGPSTITRGWDLTGNAATAGSSFLGTTNNVSLRFRTNNAQRMILDSLGNVGFGTNSPTERVHVVGSGYFTGDVRIGASTINATNLSMTRALTGATTAFAANLITTVQSDVLQGIGYASAMATQATPFSTIIRHFYAQQGTFGAGSTVTQQAGFFAASNLIGATENYGFHGTIPSGTGRWNAYMSGTANNALAGSTIIGATTTPSARLHVQGAGATSSTWTAQFHNSTGANNALMVRDDGNVGVGTNAPGYKLDINGNCRISTILDMDSYIKYNSTVLSRDNRDNSVWTQSASAVASNRDMQIGNGTYSTFRFVTRGIGFGSSVATSDLVTNWFFASGYTSTGTNGLAFRIVGQNASAGNFNGGSIFLDAGLKSGSGVDGNIILGSTSGSVGIGTASVSSSASLDVTSTTKGFLPPRMTADQASAITSPAEGLMVYVTNTNATFPTKGWYGWNGAAWEKLNN